MAIFATISDLLEVEPTIQDYGQLDFDIELARSQTEVVRVLTVRWWNSYKKRLSLGDSARLDADLLTASQWTQATVYHSLAYHICPKLTQFSPETDKFQVMMEYYSKRFEHEMDLILREGVQYDADDSGTVSDTERVTIATLRLQR
jgi:hypothetical protein